ncbi:WD40 repeat domain-containing protein [Aspergillus homomorphus CBS 101889]|uniref:Nephrocystin 3-like N-terminal domain-containing protein n=1 Tax=Aspergillus homomorphus (strain CBS 101889) TaxID=1450537 RepID=A0A395HWY1_ASPHC|nr:hypothetical protein BO97DRAFT_390008 [Aspergillus homomorphus CBS 101889]RAL12411.1 hypothetical protein BO97DRAFT_390008 [Aspergillus homomorphus CBS 101889]
MGSVQYQGNNLGFWVGINHGDIHAASEGLPIADGATYDAYANEHLGCLDGTRTEILDRIEKWAVSTQGECIFWLNGGAGTGKSCIAFEAAKRLDKEKLLGASFFFKRGGGDRGHAKRLFPTIARQLKRHVPPLKPLVITAIKENPGIVEKSLREQWDKLILQPVLALGLDRASTMIVVIDALDECDSEPHRDDIRTILQLLSQAQKSNRLLLRFLLTSRPEHTIRLVFDKMSDGLVSLDLNNDVREEQIDRDISIFLELTFTRIREDNDLDLCWPGDKALERLLHRTKPLFIAAVTLCRFIEEARWESEERLEEVLADQTDYVSKMAEVYLPVLRQLFKGQSKIEIKKLVQEFREIVGTIVSLVEPLSPSALAEILGHKVAKIRTRLSGLYSVLDVPTDHAQPVRPLHISFRDYLLDEETRETASSERFWIDEKQTNQCLSLQCLRIMNAALRQNMYDLPGDSIYRRELDITIIQNHLPPELNYACRYWIHHLARSQNPNDLLENTFAFLQVHFLHWLETLGVQGLIYEVVGMLDSLQSLYKNEQSKAVQEFLGDARRFVLRNIQLLDLTPLQIYSSGLIFTPENSVIRTEFSKNIPSWLVVKPEVDKYWSSRIQMIEVAEPSFISSVAFSPQARVLASGYACGKIDFWDLSNGQYQYAIQTPSSSSVLIVFSPDGGKLASGSMSGEIELWDFKTESYVVFADHLNLICSISFSSDGLLLASASIDGDTRPRMHRVGHLTRVTSLTYSPERNLLASSSDDNTIKLWNGKTGGHYRDVGAHPAEVHKLAFSPCGHRLASASQDGSVKLWDLRTNQLSLTWRHESNAPGDLTILEDLTFSPDRRLLASSFSDGSLIIWDLATYQPKHYSRLGSGSGNPITFSPDGQLVLADSPSSLRFWDPYTGHWSDAIQRFPEHLSSISFSPDGRKMALDFHPAFIEICDADEAQSTRRLFRHEYAIWADKDNLISIYEEQWVCVNGIKILWLPAKYRPSCIAWKAGILALGLYSGKIVFMSLPV